MSRICYVTTKVYTIYVPIYISIYMYGIFFHMAVFNKNWEKNAIYISLLIVLFRALVLYNIVHYMRLIYIIYIKYVSRITFFIYYLSFLTFNYLIFFNIFISFIYKDYV